MKQVLIKDGNITVEDVPAPEVQPGCILVQTSHSCISSGTELSVLRDRVTPLWRKAMNKPEKIIKVLEMAQRDGLRKTWNAVDQKLNAPMPMGYSAAGSVVAVGDGVHEFQVGDLVACGGAQCAFHAEVLCVPVNLAVKVPPETDNAAASTVALGAIALQGVRRLQPTLGETFVVFGLGILGQIAGQILRANGCRVIGIDLDEARLKMAREWGAHEVLSGREANIAARVTALTEGVGADGVLITASGSAPELISQSFQSCRRKGRVVLVGDVPLDLNRADMFEKELDFLISTSYGPGRYDQRFEEHGQDYPIGYVRWTETRNMSAYLQLVNDGQVKLTSLLEKRFPLPQAAQAFKDIAESGHMTALLEYPDNKNPTRTISLRAPLSGANQGLRLAVVGAGSFTRAMHAPILKSLQKDIEVRAVVSRQGHSARSAADLLGAAVASTDYAEVLRDPGINAVFIATRHDLHAEFALMALKAGKHVFLEKPLALTSGELQSLRQQSLESAGKALLFTGFNRRFSPAAVEIRQRLRNRKSPVMIQYTMNAGFLPREHWVHGPEGGGRNLGEACHVYDLFAYWAGASGLASVSAEFLNPSQGPFLSSDNFSAAIRFKDGSVATLLYTSMGNPKHPKESCTLFCDGWIAQLNDYKELRIQPAGGADKTIECSSKGHEEEWRAFLSLTRGQAVKGYDPSHQFLATEIALMVEKQSGGILRPS